jgi:nitroreductase/NAD-dependent dihydropyrimidine dehydrogenase PreA subunit
MITVNESQCTGCAICTKVCPVGVLEIDYETHKAAVIPENADKCFLCGQCEAHCPDDAIEVTFETGATYEGELDTKKITPGQIANHMTSRRSVRNFKTASVARENIEALIEIVRFAPTGMNTQAVKWLIVHDKNTMQKIEDLFCEWANQTLSTDKNFPMRDLVKHIMNEMEAENDLFFRDAPHLAIAYTPSSVNGASIDAAIAATYFELAAPTFEIGTCWGGFFMLFAPYIKKLPEAIGIPEDCTIQTAIMFGHPMYPTFRIPKRSKPDLIWS